MQAQSENTYVGGFFMSQEQENAAKWEMFELWKKLSARYATLSQQVAQAAVQANGFVQRVGNNPRGIEITPLEQFPDRKDLQAIKDEIGFIDSANDFPNRSPQSSGSECG